MAPRLDHTIRPSRVVLERVLPEIDGGQFPIKRVVGEQVRVTAHGFVDGHDVLAVTLLDARAGARSWTRTPMAPLGNDEWAASFEVTAIGTHRYSVTAQVNRFGSWRRDTLAKLRAGASVSVELLIGASILEEAIPTASKRDAAHLQRALEHLRAVTTPDAAQHWLDDDRVAAIMASLPDEASQVTWPRELEVLVQPQLARFSAWYELFPRSMAATPGQHGTFKDVERQLDRVSRMGFDILYLPPIHPIGRSFRKGPNNALQAPPGAPGSPWAIGGPEGGHKAIHPELGTFEDFDGLVAKAKERGIAVALDIAFQCAPDHPYVTEHPEWFKHRPDGTIQYAENPPKKYQDIYPFDFECADWRGLWNELKSVFDFWIDHGVRVFRVDNPHTKALPFWEWALGTIRAKHPDVIFLSEAFTRPKVMYRLAKLGYTQSYTYFAWRNAKQELKDYLTELTRTEVAEYFRPSFWPNTPDILTEYLQAGGRPAFQARLVLAATLAASYGIYGPAFERCENVPREPGSEEYRDSEKYEIRHWDLDRPHNDLTELIALVNRIRRENPALQRNDTLRFHDVDNPELFCYSKSDGEEADNVVLTVVNLDPHHRQSGWTTLDLPALGVDPSDTFQAHDLLTGARYLWHGPHNYIELDPAVMPAHLFRIRRRTHTEQDFDYFL